MYAAWVCPACKKHPVFDEHHIIHRRNGCECPVNKIGLCRECHSLLHAKGRITFFTKLKPHLLPVFNAAIDHRDARNRGELTCPETT